MEEKYYLLNIIKYNKKELIIEADSDEKGVVKLYFDLNKVKAYIDETSYRTGTAYGSVYHDYLCLEYDNIKYIFEVSADILLKYLFKKILQ